MNAPVRCLLRQAYDTPRLAPDFIMCHDFCDQALKVGRFAVELNDGSMQRAFDGDFSVDRMHDCMD